jgi:hypothetical protein
VKGKNIDEKHGNQIIKMDQNYEIQIENERQSFERQIQE